MTLSYAILKIKYTLTGEQTFVEPISSSHRPTSRQDSFPQSAALVQQPVVFNSFSNNNFNSHTRTTILNHPPSITEGPAKPIIQEKVSNSFLYIKILYLF